MSSVPTAPGTQPSGKWFSPFYFGSNYLGPGGADGAPVTSDVDAYGYLHDGDYDAQGASGPVDAFLDSRPAIINADWRLAARSAKVLARYSLGLGNEHVDARLNFPTYFSSAFVGTFFAATAARKTSTRYSFYY
jgi:hypothetical protein